MDRLIANENHFAIEYKLTITFIMQKDHRHSNIPFYKTHMSKIMVPVKGQLF